jgi:hypothetical protein
MSCKPQNILSKRTFFCLLIIVLLYPIIAHILMYELEIFKDKLPHGPFWEFIQIFLSGPLLLIIGLILIFKRKPVVDRIIGIGLVIISIYWVYRIINEVVNEA